MAYGYIECDVWVYWGEKKGAPLVTGMAKMCDFWHLVKDGKIPNALSIEWSFNMNVKVEIRGKDLKEFFREFYPEFKWMDEIEDDADCVIDCYDFS